jgi:hypothetical protein
VIRVLAVLADVPGRIAVFLFAGSVVLFKTIWSPLFQLSVISIARKRARSSIDGR